MTTFDQDDGKQYGEYQDDDPQGDGLVRIQWRHGDKKNKSAGFFFLAKEGTPDGFVPGTAWTAHEEYFESTDKTVNGWKAEQLPMAIICARSQPYIRGAQGAQPVWLDSWPKDSADSIAMHCDVLLIADGLQELGVVKWATNGSTVAFAIIGRADPKRDPQGGILHRIREEVLQAADVAAKIAYRKKKKLYWLFWVTIATERDPKGQIVYTPTKGPMVTIPRVQLPPTIDRAWLVENFVGQGTATYGEEMRSQYDAWRLTKQGNEPVTPTAGGRNVPQAIEEDLPF